MGQGGNILIDATGHVLVSTGAVLIAGPGLTITLLSGIPGGGGAGPINNLPTNPSYPSVSQAILNSLSNVQKLILGLGLLYAFDGEFSQRSQYRFLILINDSDLLSIGHSMLPEWIWAKRERI